VGLIILSLAQVALAGPYVLEGQHKGDTNTWVAGNLQNWQELDYIPCRIRISSGPIASQTFTINFPHLNGTTPGFENLYNFSASSNVVFLLPPVLSAPRNADWAWTFTVRVTDNQPATINFFARLAAGAHLNTGSSLMLGGSPSSMGSLQVHKPAAGPGAPNLAIRKTGPATAPQGGTITYTLAYTNKSGISTAVGAQISDILPPEIVVLTNSLPPNAQLAGHTIFWDLTNVAAYASGSVSFQAQVFPTTPVGRVITNFAQILSSENDADYSDNSSTWLTTVTSGCLNPPLTCAANKTVECGSAWTFDPPSTSDAAAAASLAIVSTVTNGACGNTFSATRTWTATDACGNVSQCSQTVTVVDTTAPVITCVANKTIEFGTAWTFDAPSASDTCGTNAIVILNTTTNAGCGNTFTATRTWQATDACGNTAQCSQTVTVVDTTAPTLTCVGNKTVEAGTAWDFDVPTASEGTPQIVSTTSTTQGCTHTHTRTWQVADACGNVAQCSQTVTVVDTTAPTVAILSPTNGTTYIAPGVVTIVADVVDAAGAIQDVAFFFGTNLVGQATNGGPYILTLTNVAAGTYELRAVAVDTCGNAAASAPVTFTVLERAPLSIISAMRFNPQTGLLEQKVRVFNPTTSEYQRVRVYVENLTGGATVWNKSGITNGIPYVQSAAPVLPGSYVDFVIEYYVPTPTVPNPTLRPELIGQANGGIGVTIGAGQHIIRAVMLSNRTYLLEFNSVTGRLYYVQYSADLRTWKTAQQAITGTGTRIQWVDNGLPKTESAPSQTPMRYYRVIALE
jgi:uncharacterized repeat protein (TIGR01451 family)